MEGKCKIFNFFNVGKVERREWKCNLNFFKKDCIDIDNVELAVPQP